MRLLYSFLLALLMFFPSELLGDNRRHFIILQDNSGSFYQASAHSIKTVQNAVISLFDNAVSGSNSNYSLIKKEEEQGIKFFDPNQDEISFLWFVADQKGNVNFYRHTDGGFRDFEEYFFTLGNTPMFRGSTMGVDEFFKDNFSHKPKLNSYANSFFQVYSFTSLAYPLCLDVIQTDYCKEYIVIIISDFKTGSTFGNRQDEALFRHVFRDKSDSVLNRASQLRGQFVTIDFCDFLSGQLGYYAFKIRPNAGSPNPENIELRSNSNIIFNQTAYASDSYTLQKSEVVFKHSEDLHIDEVGIEVLLPSDERVYRDVTRLTESGEETGNYMINKVTGLNIPSLKEKDIDYTSVLRYAFKTHYVFADEDGGSIKYVFDTTRSLSRSNFNLKTKLSPFQMASLVLGILLALALLLAIYLYIKGKPKGILIKFNHFNDSYETVDFSSEGTGKVHTDYRPWSDNDEKYGFELKVEGKFDYQKENMFYNWRRREGFPVRVYPRIKPVPGFDIYASSGNKTSNSEDIPIEIDSFTDGVFSFVFKIRKTKAEPITEPIKFELGAYLVSTSSGLLPIDLEKVMKRYEFHVGPDLGNVWLGVDPGTTGSCIAVGTSRSDVTIEKDAEGKDVISPSVIVINPDGLTDDSPSSIRRNTLFGAKAEAINSEKLLQNKFVSIKKLLGYNERFRIGNGLFVNSSLLSTLLIEGLFKQQKAFVSGRRLEYPQFFNDRGQFAPQRAAFAIPNNFTAAKIQQLKNCILEVENLTIKDIRFIYEAEAIIVNYLNSPESSETRQRSPEGENIFIFDMGGATINATLANVKQRLENKDWVYDISIISKLGYGIGGDTIDYAYLQWIFSKRNSFRILDEKNPFVARDAMGMVQRRKLKNEVLKLKKSTIFNYKADKSNLIDRIDITNFNHYNLNILGEDDPFLKDCQNNQSSFLYSEIFNKYVWSNIRDIISDILLICSEKSILSLDTVIMSGRSSHFPRVKDIVEDSITTRFHPRFILLELEESKSAVAKGACFYGTQSSRIKLKNMTTNGVFGVIQTLSPTKPSRFIKLIGDSMDFKDGIVTGEQSIDKGRDFIYDGRRVRFCQVMGVNPDKIIEKDEKHKYTEIASIEAQPFAIKAVSVIVSEKDKVQCGVTDVNDDVRPPVEAVVCDSDIMACNDEQYTFFVKQS